MRLPFKIVNGDYIYPDVSAEKVFGGYVISYGESESFVTPEEFKRIQAVLKNTAVTQLLVDLALNFSLPDTIEVLKEARRAK